MVTLFPVLRKPIIHSHKTSLIWADNPVHTLQLREPRCRDDQGAPASSKKCLNLPCYQAAKQQCLVWGETCQPASPYSRRVTGPFSLNPLPVTGDALSLTQKSHFKTAWEGACLQLCRWHIGKDVELGEYRYSLAGVCLVSCKHAETQKQRQQRTFSSCSLQWTGAACQCFLCQQQLKLRSP